MEGRTGDCGKNLRRSVASGEMPIEPGNSWFSTKAIEVVCYWCFYIVKYGPSLGLTEGSNYESVRKNSDKQTLGEKVECQDEKNQDWKLRTWRESECEKREIGEDSEEVGLESAIFERLRNSWLNERIEFENWGGRSWTPKFQIGKMVVEYSVMRASGVIMRVWVKKSGRITVREPRVFNDRIIRIEWYSP